MNPVTNQALLEKTMTTADFLDGGELNSVQQDRLVVLVRSFANLLNRTRFVRMPQARMDIDKLHLGEPISESADENTDAALGTLAKAKFDKVELLARKLRSQWHLTTESIQQSIESNNFEDTIFEAMTRRIASDLELLAIQGDSSIVGTATARDRLLKRLDGWLLQAEEAHILDVGGVSIEKGIFHAAWRKMPKQFRSDPGLRWIMSDTIASDWMDYLSDRETTVGDQNLTQGTVNPINIPIIKVPHIPDDLAVDSAAATPAQVLSGEQGPFSIVAGSNDGLTIDVDNNGIVAITLTEGQARLAVEVAADINAALVLAGGYGAAFANFARDDGLGRLFFESPTTGAASEIDISAGTSLATLGLTVAVVVGAAAGSGTVIEGSTILLANPENLIFGMLDGTRVFSEFNKNFDRIETIIYNQVEAKIENLDGVVKVKNLRLRDLF